MDPNSETQTIQNQPPPPPTAGPEQTVLADDDGDFGDFADFQTFADSSEATTTTIESPTDPSVSISGSTNSSPAHLAPKFPNIYDLDMFAFQEFVTNFEEQLLQMFVPSSAGPNLLPKSSSSNLAAFGSEANADNAFFFDESATNLGTGPTSPIHSQEDIINDCPIWYNLTGSYNCKPPLQFLKSRTFQHFLHSLNAQSAAAGPRPKKKKITPRSRASPRRILSDLPANMKSRLTLITQQDLRELDDTLDGLDIGESDEELYEDNNPDGSLVDEEELANDLDMHSLIVAGQPVVSANPLDRSRKPDPMVASADEVIEEIESIMSNDAKRNGPSFGPHHHPPKPANPILSLNAATLLDAAIQSWESYQDEEEENGYHSLPANLNTPAPPESEKPVPKHPRSPNPGAVPGTKTTTTTTAPNPTLVNKLSRLSIVQLNELYMELEQIIQMRSEILIQELALRDELEFEKELKNQFISLLLSVQNKRRYYTSSSGSGKPRPKLAKPAKANLIRRNSTHGSGNESSSSSGRLMSRARLDFSSLGSSLRESFRFSGSGSSAGPTNPVYLTTVIPYVSEMNVDISTLQMLIKLLTAMDEDSSTVPALLTDYILKVICP